METVTLKKENLIAAHKAASPEQKQMLQALYPNLFGNIKDRVKTIEDACRELCIDEDDRHDDCPDAYKEAERDIEIFAEALREGKPENECFYYPYFTRSGGSGFSFFGFARGYSPVGARLRVDTPDKARHLGKCMEAQYNVYLKG